MVHRSTPRSSVFRSYVGGGSRSAIDSVDDSKLMQESTKSGGMAGETFFNHEAPQNYGFTSVVADALKDASGKIQQCAEGFVSFLGGNRSLPITGVMDDRRHRLVNLAMDAAKGSTAMFGLKEWGQQFLNTDTGMYMTGNNQKKIRTQLVDNQNGQTAQQGGAAPKGAVRGVDGRLVIPSSSGVEFNVEEFVLVPETHATNGGGGSGGQGQQQQSKATGQKTLHKESSTTWHELNANYQQLVRGNGNVKLEDSKTQTYHQDETTSTRCDDTHVHIRKAGMKIWVDKGGCHATVPITIVDCGDGGGGAAAAGRADTDKYFIYPPQPTPYDVTSSSPPIEITDGNVAMTYQQPIAVGTGATPPLILQYAPPLTLNTNGFLTVGPLSLDGGTF